MNLNGEIYTRISYLNNYGIKSTTINNRMSENRKGRTNSYQHIADPFDKRVKWIKYSSIPLNTFKKYHLPIPEQLLEGIENEKQSKVFDLIKRTLYHAYEMDYIHFIKNYQGVFNEKEAIDNYAKTHSIFNSISSLKTNGIEIKQMFRVYQEFDDLEFKCISLKSFYNKLNDFEKKGHLVFIHKSFGKVLAKRKITDKHLVEIGKLFRKPELLPARKILDGVNLWAMKNGYSQLSATSIKRIISDPHFQNKNRAFRNGKEWVDKNFKPFSLRHNPEFNGELWQIDGSRLQIAFLGKDNMITFYHLFIVLDVHSRKVIGFSFDKSENHRMVIRAIQMAVKNTGYIPKELLRDNGSCFSKKAYKHIELSMAYLATYIRKHKVAHPQDKSQVERFFGKFQTVILKFVKGYVGEGITSRRFEGRPSADVLEKIFKGENIFTQNEMDKLIPELINRYNEFSMHKNDFCPRLKFEIGKVDSRSHCVSDNEFALMFWECKIKSVKQSMIILNEGPYREKQFQYIINDEELRYALNLTEVKVFYQRSDRSIIKIFDKNDEWITDLKLTPKIKSVHNRKRVIQTKPLRPVSEKYHKIKPIKNISKSDQIFKQKATLKILSPKTKNND